MSALERRRFLAAFVAGSWSKIAIAEPLLLSVLPGEVHAPDFALPDLDRTIHHVSAYRGRILLINFWAVWCAPRRRELPALSALRARLNKMPIEILAVNLGDSVERVRAFLADHPARDLPILKGDDTTRRAWRVQGLPVSFAVDPNGIIRLGAMGERDWQTAAIEQQPRNLR
jgi:thiol-disulfide isomerase/thioredoxin